MNIDSITRTFGTTGILTLIINVLSAIGVTVGIIAALSATNADVHTLSSHSDITVPNETNSNVETEDKKERGSNNLSSKLIQTENPQPIIVEQGMRIFTSVNERTSPDGPTTRMLKGCTLSYIDHEHKLGYTSAHCLGTVNNGTYTGGAVTVKNGDNEPIGYAWPNTRYVAGEDYNPYDIAVIRFDDTVILGDNIYSGNTVLTSADIVESDTFCTYGATSLTVRCGDDTSSYGLYRSPGEFHIIGTATQKGDSGSPVWVRDEYGNTKGYLGVLSGHIRDRGPNAIGTALESLNRAEFDDHAFADI